MASILGTQLIKIVRFLPNFTFLCKFRSEKELFVSVINKFLSHKVEIVIFFSFSKIPNLFLLFIYKSDYFIISTMLFTTLPSFLTYFTKALEHSSKLSTDIEFIKEN